MLRQIAQKAHDRCPIPDDGNAPYDRCGEPTAENTSNEGIHNSPLTIPESISRMPDTAESRCAHQAAESHPEGSIGFLHLKLYG